MADSFGPSAIPVRLPVSYPVAVKPRMGYSDLLKTAIEAGQDSRTQAAWFQNDNRNYKTLPPANQGVAPRSDKGVANSFPIRER